MTAAVTGGGTATASAATASPAPAPKAARQRRPGFPKASSTPGKVRLVRAGLFARLEADLSAAIRADQAVFAASASAGSGAFTGLAAGTGALALAMAVGCAWGLSQRLAEYR